MIAHLRIAGALVEGQHAKADAQRFVEAENSQHVRQRVARQDGDGAEADACILQALHIGQHGLCALATPRVDALVTVDVERYADAAREEALLAQQRQVLVGQHCEIGLEMVGVLQLRRQDFTLQPADGFVVVRRNQQRLSAVPDEADAISSEVICRVGYMLEECAQLFERHPLLVGELVVFVAIRAAEIAVL